MVHIAIFRSPVVSDNILKNASTLLKKITTKELKQKVQIHVFNDLLPNDYGWYSANLLVLLEVEEKERSFEDQVRGNLTIASKCVKKMTEALREIIPKLVVFNVMKF